MALHIHPKSEKNLKNNIEQFFFFFFANYIKVVNSKMLYIHHQIVFLDQNHLQKWNSLEFASHAQNDIPLSNKIPIDFMGFRDIHNIYNRNFID